MSKETRHPHQPPLNMLGCVALLNAVRADRPKIRVNHASGSWCNPRALGIAKEQPDRD
jgi:hypothetical protein